MRVFLDANILFCAAKSESGASAYLFEIAEDFGLELLTCDYAREEAQRNLLQKASQVLPRFKKLLLAVEIVPTVIALDCPKNLVDKDVPIYASAQSAHAEFLVTLDKKDFGFLMDKKGGPLITLLPGDFLKRLRRSNT